jgi:DNA mismatch repair ATPase MutS
METYYKGLIEDLDIRIRKLGRSDNYFTIARLLGFIFFLLSLIMAITLGSVLWIILTLATLWGFILILLRHFRLLEKKREFETKRNMYNNEVNVLNLKGNEYYNGIDFIDPDHDFTSDMDVFGDHSVFGYVNRCATGVGNLQFSLLLSEMSPLSEIKARQEATRELAGNNDWCINLRTDLYNRKISSFAKEFLPEIKPVSHKLKRPGFWIITSYLILAICILAVFAGSTNVSVLIFPIIFNIIVFQFTGKFIKTVKAGLEGRESILNDYRKVLQQFESKEWESGYLNHLKDKIKQDGISATNAIKRLGSLSQKLDYTLNMIMALILNFFFLWDLIISIKIARWFDEYAAKTNEWFEVIGKVEALISISNLQFNHPRWVYPQFSENGFQFRGEVLGHPLIPEYQRVCNDFDCYNGEKVSVITGSNMAGKSTFLRTVGVNIILARTGGPVCAGSLTLSNFRIMTYLNITDSLSENTSTFYREIKRLKKILDSARSDNNVLLLLDELLRGTNSADKARGSIAITRELIRNQIPAIIATHNLELAQLQIDFPQQIENYYFDIIIDKNSKMLFDYKIKHGICNTFNASLLLREIGIDINHN